MLEFRIFLVVLIWTSGLVALVTGYFYSPNFRASRSSNPKAYWAGMATSTVVGIIATVLLLRG